MIYIVLTQPKFSLDFTRCPFESYTPEIDLTSRNFILPSLHGWARRTKEDDYPTDNVYKPPSPSKKILAYLQKWGHRFTVTGTPLGVKTGVPIRNRAFLCMLPSPQLASWKFVLVLRIFVTQWSRITLHLKIRKTTRCNGAGIYPQGKQWGKPRAFWAFKPLFLDRQNKWLHNDS